MRKLRLFGAVAMAMLLLSSCNYYDLALADQGRGDPVPWWCTGTEEIPVTAGPASGSVDWYAGTHKAPLPWAQCLAMSAQFDAARTYALQWPTAGAAEAAGWRKATGYVAGMGTHHVLGGITPAMLADPAFNRLNPILDSIGLDTVFDPARPDVLQYDGNGPSAKLVGFDYYVRTATGLPPAGFAGNNDWWHHHPWICHRLSDATMIGFNVSDATCAAQNGINVNFSNYYMLHVWVLEDMIFTPDVFAGMMPCIANGTAVHDPLDPCHTTRGGAGAATMAGHDMEMDGHATDMHTQMGD